MANCSKSSPCQRWLIATFAILLIPNAARSAIDVARNLGVVGDVRGGYYGSQRTDRDDSEDSTDQLLGRVRAGLEWTPTDTVSAHFDEDIFVRYTLGF